MIGHGGIVVFDDTSTWPKQARFAMEFCAIESCGKCTPCRIGSTRGVETIDKIIAASNRAGQPRAARDLCEDHDRRLALRAGRLTPYAGA
jgi:formate dehydrogenase iron-sulfur subunit